MDTREFQRAKELCDYFYVQARDNLFRANHRTKMLTKYGYTEARFVTIEELMTGKHSLPSLGG
jgi:hypothetical protein